jgi:hypothetical protein
VAPAAAASESEAMSTPRHTPPLADLARRHAETVRSCQQAQSTLVALADRFPLALSEREAVRIAAAEWAVAEHERGSRHEALRLARHDRATETVPRPR